MTSAWEKFLLLLWKNWTLQRHSKLQTILEVVLPSCLALLLVLIRYLVVPEEVNTASKYAPEEIENINNLRYFIRIFRKPNYNSSSRRIDSIKEWAVYYSPENEFLGQVVSEAALKFNLNVVAKKNATDLEVALMRKRPLAGVQFDDSLSEINDISTELSYSLRFPSELRTAPQGVRTRHMGWMTNYLFPEFQRSEPRNRFSKDGGIPPGYINEGFAALQHAISSSFIKLAAKEKIQLPKVVMQRFPYPPYRNDLLLENLEFVVGFIIVLCFVNHCASVVKCITKEKEEQIKEVMKIMGVDNWLHWTAWFVKSYTMFVFSALIITVLLKIRPGTNVAILTNSSFSAVFVFLLIYAISGVTFCFAMSVFFSKANTAAALTGILWFVVYMPYVLTQNQQEALGLGGRLGMSIFVNTALSFGFKSILQLEGKGVGLQWSNIWEPVSADDEMTVGYVILMFLLSSVIHMIIALYVEQIYPGNYGMPAKWYFFLTKEFWCGAPAYLGIEDSQNSPQTTNSNYEPGPDGKHVGIQALGLRKRFGKKMAVSGLTMNMYEDEITVLLGHNGAGKTTTISMLTGILPPTSGTAIINGSDIIKNLKGARISLGFCPQTNILFDNLTVREHITFYSRLKGVPKEKVNLEVAKYIQALQLEDKMNTPSSKLSGGMKRKLCLIIALCGGSKVVFCDEPTSGMDPAARRALWDLLQKEKKGRTILLSTHFMDEADVLGDRIAIMSEGDLRCYGTSFFLKKKFGAGYHLICVKGNNCNPSDVTALLRKYVPTVEIESNIGAELSYKLPEEYISVFENMLTELDTSSEKLKINGYGISVTTLEEVFFNIATEKIANGEITQNKNHIPPEELTLHRGKRLILNQWTAMILKKFLYTIRNLITFLMQIFIPVFFLIITVIVLRAAPGLTPKPLPITLSSYGKTVTVLETSSNATNNIDSLIASGYKSLFLPVNPIHELVSIEDNFEDYLLKLSETMLTAINSKYLAAATIQKGAITAWFNNQGYHTVPLSLNLVHNAIARAVLGSEYNIKVKNSPLPYRSETLLAEVGFGNDSGFVISLNLGFAMCYASAFYILFIIKERESRAKLLQFVGGVSVPTFWLSQFICDLLQHFIICIVLVITMGALKQEGWSTPDELSRIFLVFFLFGVSSIPSTYLISRLFKEPINGYSLLSFINIFTGMACYITVSVLSLPIFDLKYIADGLTWFFMIFPHFSLLQSLNRLSTIKQSSKLCDLACHMLPVCDMNIMCMSPSLEICCNEVIKNGNYFSWDNPGIGTNITYFVGGGVIFFLVLLILEYRLLDKLIFNLERTFMTPSPSESEDGFIDADVKREKEFVSSLSEYSLRVHNLVLDRVTKYYGRFLAVNQISVAIKPYECFGLLGVNGAGKTTTFKMMTGDEKISNGGAHIVGLDLTKDLSSIYQEIGYCPQFDGLLEDLTGRETLRIFCLLRGIPKDKINKISEEMANDLSFMKHIDKKIKAYSGGNKRKLSTAIALVGNPSVIFLDEPTTGMDPGAKRQLWNVVCRIRDSGKSVILTSHSMDECEALCTRLAIMVNGEFKCLGSIQHLKNKFSQGLVLIIKLKKSEDEITSLNRENLTRQTYLNNIKAFVKTNFPNAVLREEHEDLLTFHIPLENIKWSKLFGLMEKNRTDLNIADYSISQTTLEQIFLEFARHQREDNKETLKSRKRCLCC